jgi:hypothetical protein
MNLTETKTAGNDILISKGTRHVSIVVNAETVVALKHVGNVHYTLADCVARWEGKTVAGARKWAAKQLG